MIQALLGQGRNHLSDQSFHALLRSVDILFQAFADEIGFVNGQITYNMHN